MASGRLLLCSSGSGSSLSGAGPLLMAMLGEGVGAGTALEQVEGRGAGRIGVAAARFWACGCQRGCANRGNKRCQRQSDKCGNVKTAENDQQYSDRGDICCAFTGFHPTIILKMKSHYSKQMEKQSINTTVITK